MSTNLSLFQVKEYNILLIIAISASLVLLNQEIDSPILVP